MGEVTEKKASTSILKKRKLKPEMEDTKVGLNVKKSKLKKSTTKWDRLARVKPDPLDRDHERHLVVAATKGVVQLFNAIKGHQTDVNKQIGEAKTVRKTEKTLKTLKKGKFFEKLSKPAVKDEEFSDVKKEHSRRRSSKTPNDKATASKKWGVLSDDFLTSTSMENPDIVED